jgi:hypothetical protein
MAVYPVTGRSAARSYTTPVDVTRRIIQATLVLQAAETNRYPG